jgi:putative transposase
MQKLKYLHNNPMAEHWDLVQDPYDDKYSSARYHGMIEKNFDFLKDLLEEF